MITTSSAQAGQISYPTSVQKNRITLIIKGLAKKSEKANTLDEFGRMSMKESKEVLDMGPGAVYVLSLYWCYPDWKVRYWIADILGYLENPDAERPLQRMLQNPHERDKVKLRVQKSLKRLEAYKNKIAANE